MQMIILNLSTLQKFHSPVAIAVQVAKSTSPVPAPSEN
jgi:hypothetical protein